MNISSFITLKENEETLKDFNPHYYSRVFKAKKALTRNSFKKISIKY